MKVGDLVKHNVVYGLGLGVVVRPSMSQGTVCVLWSNLPGTTYHENLVSLELISESR